MQEGDRVIFIEEWDTFPETIVKKGEKGTIDHIDECVWIKLDNLDEGLSYWDNCVQIGHDERKLEDYVQKLEE